MEFKRTSPAKINLLLNILGRQSNGFHALESLMLPLPLCDELTFEDDCQKPGIELIVPDSKLTPGPENLIHRAAVAFEKATDIAQHLRIRVQKRIPMEAGLGGGSSNAAITLRTLNEIYGHPLSAETLHSLAKELGSDVPFFLHDQPMLAAGRGEKLQPVEKLGALEGKALLLIKPPFGVSTAWAYENLCRFPTHLNGKPGRAKELAQALIDSDLSQVSHLFYNSLEAPVLAKYPLLELMQDCLRQKGARATLMSGSGSTTFALFEDSAEAILAKKALEQAFGSHHWIEICAL